MNTSFNLIHHVKNYFTTPPANHSRRQEITVDTVELSGGREKEELLKADAGTGKRTSLIKYGIGTLAGIAFGTAVTTGGLPAVVAMTGMVVGVSLAIGESGPYDIPGAPSFESLVTTGISTGLVRGAACLLGGGPVTGAVAGGVLVAGLVKAFDWLGTRAEQGASKGDNNFPGGYTPW